MIGRMSTMSNGLPVAVTTSALVCAQPQSGKSMKPVGETPKLNFPHRLSSPLYGHPIRAP